MELLDGKSVRNLPGSRELVDEGYLLFAQRGLAVDDEIAHREAQMVVVRWEADDNLHDLAAIVRSHHLDPHQAAGRLPGQVWMVIPLPHEARYARLDQRLSVVKDHYGSLHHIALFRRLNPVMDK